jgi:hypothetical protein
MPAPNTDGDGVKDLDDNCLEAANAQQEDADADGVGDACSGASPPATGPQPGPPAVPGPAAACRDLRAPSVKLARSGVRVVRHRLRIHGTAADAGCGATRGRVARVEVAVGRRTRKRCRFLRASGGFGAPRRGAPSRPS